MKPFLPHNRTALCACWTLAVLALVHTPASATVPFDIQGPGVNPTDFRMTTFATGANFPVGMVELDDGSILVAESNGSLFGSSSGRLVRYVDTDQDGVSDSQSNLANVSFGGLTALRRGGDLVFTTGQGRGKPIDIFRLGANPSDPLTQVGSLTLELPEWRLAPSAFRAQRPRDTRRTG